MSDKLDRTAQIINLAKSLQQALEKLLTQMAGPQQEVSPALIKILRQLTITVENTLPDLRDYVDTLEFKTDERSAELQSIINHLEDNLLVKAIDYISK